MFSLRPADCDSVLSMKFPEREQRGGQRHPSPFGQSATGRQSADTSTHRMIMFGYCLMAPKMPMQGHFFCHHYIFNLTGAK